jgi:hypothetical protein
VHAYFMDESGRSVCERGRGVDRANTLIVERNLIMGTNICAWRDLSMSV